VEAGRTAVVGLSYQLTDGSAHLVRVHGLDVPVNSAP
jgi:hypothetical protein